MTDVTYTAYPYTDASEFLEGAGMRSKAVSLYLTLLPEVGVRALAEQAATGTATDVATRLASMSLAQFSELVGLSPDASADALREELRAAVTR